MAGPHPSRPILAAQDLPQPARVGLAMNRHHLWHVPRSVQEVPHPGSPAGPSIWVHPEWSLRFPWLAQGTTGRGHFSADFALFREDGPTVPPSRWVKLAVRLGLSSVVHAKQVHEAHILSHGRVEGGLSVGPDADGHATATPGVLMAVTVADCVPVFLVDPERRVVCVLHAGWRGCAAGILERGVERLTQEFGCIPSALVVHFGPAICGGCYEVGPEVHMALGLPDPGEATPVDLRGVLASRALALGVEEDGITSSAFCTRCGDSPFFSHRGGDSERQIGFLGLQPPMAPGLCGVCIWTRTIENRRGSQFLLCRKSETDQSFRRYPDLPVLECKGFQVVSG